MANSERRYIDNNGNQFMPMNVEGGSWHENFITTPKLICLFLILFSLVIVILSIADGAGFRKAVVFLGAWFIISTLVIRYIVFEEKFYYRMYTQLKGKEITTPSLFWNIASIRDTPDGAILTYADTRVAILIKMERDTITGKHQDFKEIHYDAISDFYREISRLRYSFIQFNIMEKAGNDPRLETLDPLVHKNSNQNICLLMEKEVGYIKAMTRNTLYESDYILIYTKDLSKVDSIVGDSIECIYKLLEGAYIGYRIMTKRDIIEFIKDLYGVNYFDYTQAVLDMHKANKMVTSKPFKLIGIKYTDGDYQELDNVQVNRVNNITSRIINGTVDINKISIKEALIKKNNINKNNYDGIDIDNLGQRNNNQSKVKTPPKINMQKTKQTGNVNRNQQNINNQPIRQKQLKNNQNLYSNGIELFGDQDYDEKYNQSYYPNNQYIENDEDDEYIDL